MTRRTPDGTGTGTDPLQRCVGDVCHFADHVWGRRTLVRDPTEGGFDDLLSLHDIDALLSGHGLRTPAFRLVQDGDILPTAEYTRSARIGTDPMSGIADPTRIFDAVERGATLVLQGLQRCWPALGRFCRDLELALGHPCQANAYLTPPGSQGFGAHADTHDVFVLQSFGHKTWQLWPAPAEHDAAGDSDDTTSPTSVELRPGSAVYLPTGTRHAARTQHGLSGHLTIGVHPTRWRAAMHTALQTLLDDPALDQPLPVGFHRAPDSLSDGIAEHLAELSSRLDKVAATEVAHTLADGFLTERPPLLHGGLADHLRLATLGDTDRLRRRPGSVCEVRTAEDGPLRILLGDRELRMPRRLEPALRDIAGWQTFRVEDLTTHLDAPGRLVLARRLVREGLLEVVDG